MASSNRETVLDHLHDTRRLVTGALDELAEARSALAKWNMKLTDKDEKKAMEKIINQVDRAINRLI